MGSRQQDKIVKVQEPGERMGGREEREQSDVSACSRANERMKERS